MADVLSKEPICVIAWSTGLIEFVTFNQVPSGCMMLGSSGVDGPTDHDEFKEFVSIKARHARDDDRLLVPGVPEAETDMDKISALYSWADWVFGVEPVMVM